MVPVKHGTLDVADNVRVKNPLVLSFGPGVYIGFKMLVLLKVPSPVLDQDIVLYCVTSALSWRGFHYRQNLYFLQRLEFLVVVEL